VILIHPGSLSSIPWTGSSIRGARAGQVEAKFWVSVFARGGQLAMVPSLVLAHWEMAEVRTVLSQPLRKSPWKP